MNLIEEATKLAVRAHAGQTRKKSDTPYIVHPVSVAIILARHGFGETVIAAGLVHDVVEDTEVTLEEVREKLGEPVAQIVAPVTHDDSLPWEDKKRAYVASVRSASVEAEALSVADKIANAQSLIEAHAREGSTVWRYFNAGRDKKLWFEHEMLTMLRKTWQHPLVDEYAKLVTQMDSLV
jgi:guanosine-3',5'-bis(diphosphate) 3'-pyrophosphohydrolase